jgi:hypothetical protein
MVREAGLSNICSDMRETSTLLPEIPFSQDSLLSLRGSYLGSDLTPAIFFLNRDCSNHDGIGEIGKRDNFGIDRDRGEERERKGE